MDYALPAASQPRAEEAGTSLQAGAQAKSQAAGAPAGTSPVDASAANAASVPTPAASPAQAGRDSSRRTVRSREPGPAPLVAAPGLSVSDSGRAAPDARERRATSLDSTASAAESSRKAASPGAPPPVATPVPRALADAVPTRDDPTVKADRANRRPGDTATPRTPAPPSRLRAEKIVEAEKKRLEGLKVEQVTVTGAASAVAAGAPVRSAAVARSIAGCYTIEPRPETADAPIVRLASLDTVAAGEWQARPAWEVTVLSPATLRPVHFRWSLGAEGQVLLLERRDGRNFSWILDVPQATRSATGIPARRAECAAR